MNRSRAVGVALVIISAIGFGFMGLFRSWADRAGVSTPSFLALRFFIAGLILTAIVIIQARPLPRGRQLLAIVAMGGIGYFGEALTYFKALEYIPSGLVAVLLYLYPAVVAVMSWLFFKERIGPRAIAGIVSATLGTAVMVGNAAGISGPAGSAAIGVTLGIAAAIIYAAYIVLGARAVRGADPVSTAAIVTLSASVSFGVLAFSQGFTLPTKPIGWIGIGSIAIVSTVIAVLAFLAGLQRIGPVRSATISTLEAVTTVAVGFAFLDERLAPLQVLGALFVLAAAADIAYSQSDHKSEPQSEAQSEGIPDSAAARRLTGTTPRMSSMLIEPLPSDAESAQPGARRSAPPLGPPVAELRSLRKTYYKPDGSVMVEALRGVDITIRRGEYVAIMGASGSGKSTLMNVLGCLDRPTGGTYLLDNQDIEAMSDESLSIFRGQKIGFIFQAFNLIPQLTIEENVATPLFYQGVPPKDRIARAIGSLEAVGLGDRLGHRPRELSGGQQQRVAIARALVTRPVILMADEPTGNLDSSTGNAILKLFEDLHQRGMTIIMVTHDDNLAKRCLRVIRLKDGLLEFDRQQAGYLGG